MAAMSLTTPELVSICTASTALMAPALSSRSRCLISAGSTARRQSPLTTSASMPSRAAASPQSTAKRPLSSTKILSPRESTFVSAASQAPWPLAV